MSPVGLEKVLGELDISQSENVIVGLKTFDDAAVYKLNEETYIVQTADFITPVLDNPYDYGQVAVANALSDVYAMGGTPLTAINLVMFASCKVPENYLKRIIEGGAEKLKEAGVDLVGGHTVDDLETKYGLCVMGIVKKENLTRNSTAKEGNVLIYTKPLGIGVLTTAIKADLASPEDVQEVTTVMTHLNKDASEAMIKIGVNACTDITGFGFLGHLYEMLRGNSLGATIFSDKLNLLNNAREFASMGLLPAATYSNIEYVGNYVEFKANIDEDIKMLLFDPQTSGGLLISMEEGKVDSFINALPEKSSQWIQIVGTVDKDGKIKVT